MKTLFLVGLLTCLSGQVFAQSYTDLIAFGDSLSDTGNASIATFGLVPSSPPFSNGRFTNGSNWLDCFSHQIGHDAVASLAGGDNYALGGAQALNGTLSLQKNSYLGDVSNVADSGALYIAWIGGNDVNNRVGEANQYASLDTALASFTNDLLDLANAGATTMLVPNLPDIGLTPSHVGSGTQAEASALTAHWNAGIANTVIPTLRSAGVMVFDPDIFGFYNEVISNPAQLGYTNVTDQGMNDAGVIAGITDINEFLYIDGLHPTEPAHLAICDVMLESIQVPEPSSALLTSLSLALLLKRRRAV